MITWFLLLPVVLILFLHLILLLKTSNTSTPNKLRKNGHICIILDFIGNGFSFSHLIQYWRQVCHMYPLLCWIIFLIIMSLWEFCHGEMLVFLKSFMWIYWNDHVVSTFSLFTCCTAFIDLWALRTSLYRQDETKS